MRISSSVEAELSIISASEELVHAAPFAVDIMNIA
jgi:hypothetical protein